MDDATRNQIAAADPARSTWLTANAGSGKTRVLTDRVARLLLAGSAPERILCLTYTKAAATEMQNRLLRRLGQWAMLPEAELRAALGELDETRTPDLAEARRLFARAIETPGGLKVQTIHSFCAALLRRFPLEAGVPMDFTELDDRSARTLRADVVEDMARDGDPAMADLTTLHSGDDLDRFLAGLSQADYGAAPDRAAIWRRFELPAGLDRDRLLAQIFDGDEGDLFDALIPILRAGKSTDQGLARTLAKGRWRDPGMEEAKLLFGALLTGEGAKAPFTAKIGSLPTKDLRLGACAPFMPALEDLMQRVEDARPTAIALSAAERTLALHRFGHAFRARLGLRKSAHGWLDFDDLIGHSARLLESSGMAQWVLWRLDGGIDHILVDEAQDTSPAQWRVIRRLTDEFTSGMGASPRPRTLFVVGDPKQSIYSFQGADITVFNEMRDLFDAGFAAIQQPMQQRELAHSFRSSPAILRLVDATFRDAASEGLGGAPHHVAFRDAMPGRVDIWPPIPAPEQPERGDWSQPVDAPAENAADTVLAQAVARQIASMIGTPFRDKSGDVRPITPGDIQILVQRRSTLFEELIRACKAAGLPVAGADRLKLAAELAVRDITATLAVLATPEDDLSLAAALRSPLFALSEDDLFRLAHGRGRQHLIQRLRLSGHLRAREVLHDLAGQADFLRPYDLISRLLARHGGRAALLARLGPEAEDGIDELLSQALAYETVEAPSLTGFLVWLASDEIEVKRQLPGGGGGLIRVMTVHGSKGLESPVVILPETRKRSRDSRAVTVRMDDAPVWRDKAPERPPVVSAAITDHQQRQDEERRRLLYVAMTRAESWLIVAAAGETGDEPLDSWHAMITQGANLVDLDRQPIEIPEIGTGLRLSFGDWPAHAAAPDARVAPMVELPDWTRRPAPPVPARGRPIAATALGGAKALPPAPGDFDPAEAMLRGTRLHLLLEHLPGSEPADWPALARAALAGSEGGLPDATELAALITEARDIIEAPDLAQVMAPPPGSQILREVELSAPLPGIGRLHGTLDRLMIGADQILAVDYKTNALVPATPEATPLGILRQMAAYRAALRLIWPDRPVRAAILWTGMRQMMMLDDALLDRVAAGLDVPTVET